jgi:hypothetical protein
MVHYNDLKADLSGEMKRIAAFLGIETPAALWPELVEAATFDKMKDRRRGAPARHRDGGPRRAPDVPQQGHQRPLERRAE